MRTLFLPNPVWQWHQWYQALALPEDGAALGGSVPSIGGDVRGDKCNFSSDAPVARAWKGSGRVLGPGRGAEGSPEPNKAPSELSCCHFVC